MNDMYIHDDFNIIYVTESLPGPYEDTPEYDELIDQYNSMLLKSCVCTNVCVQGFCKCHNSPFGENYSRHIFDDELKFELNIKCAMFLQFPLIECNSNCCCGLECGNRVVQTGPITGLKVRECDVQAKGLGLFTTKPIHKGTFVCEYAGEILTRTQAINRTIQNEARGVMNYILCLNEHTNAGPVQTLVDPSQFGNIGRYLNHSCDPNCFIVPVRIERPIPHVAIFARRDICPEEELTFDYSGDDRVSGPPFENEDDYNRRKKCFCNSDLCKGYLPLSQF